MNTNSQKVLLIFDVDGTLMLSGPVVRKAFFDAFKAVTGFEVTTPRLQFMGKTDRAIVRNLINSGPVTIQSESEFEALFRAFKQEFTSILGEVYPGSDQPYLLPGVRKLIEQLSTDDRFYLALGTGNIRETSQIKLEKFGLDTYFPAGGFGGDHELRPDVIRAAIAESREVYGMQENNTSKWVIGDTVSDVEAGHAAGCNVLAVSSGFEARENLESANPEVLLDSLEDTGKVIELFLSYR